MISVTTTTEVINDEKLSVKELASKLDRSEHYIYLAKASGFKMEWDFQTKCFVATEGKLRRWITRVNFRIAAGKAITDSKL